MISHDIGPQRLAAARAVRRSRAESSAVRAGRARRALGIAIAAAACLALQAWAAPPALAGAIEQMRAFTQGTKSASGEFSQRAFKSGGQPAEASSGRFAFIRPGRFRWEVARPYEQLMVADGQQVFFFDKDLNQVTVRKMDDALGATPAAILFGTSDLDQSFTLVEDGERDGLSWLLARPKSTDAGFDSIAIGLKGNLPRAMEVKDAFGRTTVFQFSDVERNPAVDAQQFRFVPPKGAEVVTQ
ncbi:MAG: outer membrane lipoprotein chaperone LolA [Burkholderiaceae bacterium]